MVREISIHETSSTAVVYPGAILKLLLREVNKLAGGARPCILIVASGREYPARSALTLVLRRGDTLLGGPVG